MSVMRFVPFVLLVASISFLCFVFYKSEVFWVGDNRRYYLPYYAVGVAVFILSLTIIKTSDTVKFYVLVNFLSVVFALYLFEGFSILKEIKTKNDILDQKASVYKETQNKNYDKRDKFEFHNSLKGENKRVAVAVFGQDFGNLYTLGGTSNAYTVHCNENGYWVVFQSDRYGLNNPDQVWDYKNIDFVFVGDSFTLGACLKKPKDIVSVVRKKHNNSVMNLGYDDAGPLSEYASLREYFPQGAARVIWMFYEGNDLTNLQYELNSKILSRYLDDVNFSQNLKSRQKEIDQATTSLINEKKEFLWFIKYKNFVTLSQTRKVIQAWLPKTVSPQTTPEILLVKLRVVLTEARNYVESKGAKFYFVYLPSYERYLKETFYEQETLKETKIREIVEELSLPFISIHDLAFKDETNPLSLFPFREKGHYNERGAELVADTIVKNVIILEKRM